MRGHFRALRRPIFIQYGRSAGVDNSDRFIYAVSNVGFWDRGNDMIRGRMLKSKIAGLIGADWEYFTSGDGMKPSPGARSANTTCSRSDTIRRKSARGSSPQTESTSSPRVLEQRDVYRLTNVPLELLVRDREV